MARGNIYRATAGRLAEAHGRQEGDSMITKLLVAVVAAGASAYIVRASFLKAYEKEMRARGLWIDDDGRW
jgi:hypothetical protein